MSHSCHAGACMFRKGKQVESVSVAFKPRPDENGNFRGCCKMILQVLALGNYFQ